MEILLFDLDGVLLNSAGYHRALQDAVRAMARGLGFGDQTLSRGDIEVFEALDITAEWDSSALCAALMVVAARKAGSTARLPLRPPVPGHPDSGIAFPDLQGFLHSVDRTRATDPVEAARLAMVDHLDGLPREVVHEALGYLASARDPAVSLTFWLIQLFNLGSGRLRSIYGLDPGIEVESYLEVHDRPTLSESERARLRAWLDGPGRRAAIVTNRPSASSGIFNTPEAEIGTAAAGVADLPRIAAGDLGPAAVVRGLEAQAFLKPRPVHPLAGMLCALGESAAASVEAAISLLDAAEAPLTWRRLDGARICLFEDAAKGLYGAQAAAGVLAERGVRVDLELYGIAESDVRSHALSEAGAKIFPHVRDALAAALPGWRG